MAGEEASDLEEVDVLRPGNNFSCETMYSLMFYLAQPIYKDTNNVVILECDISLNLIRLKKYVIFRILTIMFRLGEDA